MYKLLHQGCWRDSVQAELGPMFAAGVVAELFFKWHSFTLECLGFLSVWYAFGWLLAAVRQRQTAP